ncbi:hypothetical protein V6R21_16965 [Limibacter armeniacum]|uniref:hypothetical protein n=1 Tax=Limibacter armeniacum TaxID=466084 RepID=UPI002FE61B86
METILIPLAIMLLIIEVILLYLLRKNRDSLTTKVKWLVLFGIILVPIATMVFANYHVFEGTKNSETCMGCHVMAPIGADMMDLTKENSMTLAARHYRNGWLGEHECYACHKDYGFQGTFKAKMDGYRHLMRYVTNTYEEPIAYRGEFNYGNCLSCHENDYRFTRVAEHEPVLSNLTSANPTLSCLNCHGRAHPERSRRTPDHPDYKKLNEAAEQVVVIEKYIKDIEKASLKK